MAAGTVTDRPSEVLGADLREAGDGRELALAKVVAALIGVPSDEVYRRAERERRRQARNRNTVALSSSCSWRAAATSPSAPTAKAVC